MFRKTARETTIDIFSNIENILSESSLKVFNDKDSWHNKFREQVSNRIDETLFSPLYSDKMGAPNASIKLLTGMMILKESFGLSDSQLFAQCEFNLLYRAALGMFNMTDKLPAESTYYLLRKRMYEYQIETGKDLMEEVFSTITQGQVTEFEVNGTRVRMDSKLVSSNIARISRYEIIHKTVLLFWKTLKAKEKRNLSVDIHERLVTLSEEESQKIVYRSNKEEIAERIQALGVLIYQIIKTYEGSPTATYQTLKRVFEEQYEVREAEKEKMMITLRAKEEIKSGSVQSPYDPDCAYRQKKDKKIKGYSVNLTETCSDTSVQLITNVIVDTANVSDTTFVKPAIEGTIKVTGQVVTKVHADGAYQSPNNETVCEHIDMVYTGIQGSEGRYKLELTQDGLEVTDTQTGQVKQATLCKKTKKSKEDKWKITTSEGNVYFGQQAIRASAMRRIMKERPLEEQQRRNPVESAIHQLGYYLDGGKSRYRGMFKHQLWAYCRCLWINLTRIVKYFEKGIEKSKKTIKEWIKKIFFNEIPVNTTNSSYWQKMKLTLLYFF